MKKISAVIQIIFVLSLVGFGTYHLFTGNFQLSVATIPVLVFYYLFLLSRQKRTVPGRDGDQQGNE